MNIAGPTFTLSWAAPPAGDNDDSVAIYEHVGTSYNLIGTVAQPTNQATLIGVPIGVHAYVAKAHNVAGYSAAYSNEISVTVVALPATLVLAFP